MQPTTPRSRNRVTLARRTFASALAGAASVGIVRFPGRAAEFDYRSANTLPAEHPMVSSQRDLWEAVRKETDGRLNVTVFPAGQLGSDTATLAQCRQNAIQFVIEPGGVLSSIVPSASLDSIAFAFQSEAQAYAAMDGNLGAYIRGELAAKGLFVFPRIWPNGLREITTSNKPIRSVDDMQGLKLRTLSSNLWVDMFRTLGASPTPMAFGEIYVALQTHVIDGQENPYINIETGKFYEVQHYLAVTNHIWNGLWYVANPDALAALPPDIRAVVDRAVERATLQNRRDTTAANDAAADKLRGQGMVFTRPDIAGFKAKLAPYYARWKAEFGARAWELVEAYAGKLG